MIKSFNCEIYKVCCEVVKIVKTKSAFNKGFDFLANPIWPPYGIIWTLPWNSPAHAYGVVHYYVMQKNEISENPSPPFYKIFKKKIFLCLICYKISDPSPSPLKSKRNKWTTPYYILLLFVVVAQLKAKTMA